MSPADQAEIAQLERGLSKEDFWQPSFNIETRSDGTILMEQAEPLPPFRATLADYLDHWADTAPERVWIARRVDGGAWRKITYGAARAHARALGGALLNLGLGPDKPLVILSENSIEHALLGAACFYVGIPYAPISPAYALVSEDHRKLKNVVALLEPGAVFADNGKAFERAWAAIKDTCDVFINSQDPLPGALMFDDLLERDSAGAGAARSAISGETVVKYLFTSGSTGTPKAVINSNHMICAMQAMVRDCYRFLTSRPPVVLDWAPWNHTAAGNKVSYLVLTNGGTYYIDDGRPVPGKFEETLRNLRELNCTWYFNVPVGWDMLLEHLKAEPELARNFFKHLGMMFYAGAGMAQHTWDGLRELARASAGREVLLATGLGATETAPFALACTEVQDQAGNVGVPSKGLVLKLVPNGGKLELRLKGPSVTPGYFKDPVKTAEAFDDEGYYCMGDALRPVDPDDLTKGFFFDGRVAENFKLNTGTWVSVGTVRGALVDAMGGLIKDAVIVGENERELGALVLLSEAATALSAEARAAQLAQKLSAAAKAATGSASRVRRILVLEDEPSAEAGEVSEKGSLNQRAMRQSRSDQIEALYAGEGAICV